MAGFDVQGGGVTETYDVSANLMTALATKFTSVDGDGNHNDFYNDVQGRLYDGDVVKSDYPYAAWMIVSAPKEKTFSEEFTNTLLQLSIFSASSSSVEVRRLAAHASRLFDECSFTITGSTLVWMKEVNRAEIPDERTVTTPAGTVGVKHTAIDYEVLTSLS